MPPPPTTSVPALSPKRITYDWCSSPSPLDSLWIPLSCLASTILPPLSMNSAAYFQKVFEHYASHCDYSPLGGFFKAVWRALGLDREDPVKEFGGGSFRPGSEGMPLGPVSGRNSPEAQKQGKREELRHLEVQAGSGHSLCPTQAPAFFPACGRCHLSQPALVLL